MNQTFVISGSVILMLLAALLCSQHRADTIFSPPAARPITIAKTFLRPARPQDAAQVPQTTPPLDFGELVQQTLARPDPDSRRRFPLLMLQWAQADPIAALGAWHAEAYDSLPAQGWQVDPEFYRIAFTAWAKQDLKSATASLQAPDSLADRLAATQAVAKVAAAQTEQFRWLLDHPPAGEWSSSQQVLLMYANGDVSQAQDLAQYVDSPEEATELRSLLKKGYDPMQQTKH